MRPVTLADARALGAYARWSRSTASRSAAFTGRRSIPGPEFWGIEPLVSYSGTARRGVGAAITVRGDTVRATTGAWLRAKATPQAAAAQTRLIATVARRATDTL